MKKIRVKDRVNQPDPTIPYIILDISPVSQFALTLFPGQEHKPIDPRILETDGVKEAVRKGTIEIIDEV